MTATVELGDCVERMAAMPAASVDAIVTDPPYGLGFMGKEWDDLPPGLVWATECLRVLKPGGHLLAFGGTRTYHRLACAIEDAGFEIRDCLAWMYGSGFPKSLDVGKAIDKAAGAEREVIGEGEPFGRGSMRNRSRVENGYRPTELNPEGGAAVITAPATPDAEQWNGWGTALKPAYEPIVLARKPLTGTVAANVLTHGTGGLNVDATRIGGGGHLKWARPRDMGYHGGTDSDAEATESTLGRWPANVLLDPEAAALLDAQTGELTSGAHASDEQRQTAGGNGLTHGVMAGTVGAWHGDSGGASRFFYVAKASSAERNAGLDGFEAKGRTDDGYGSIQTPILDRATPRENWTPHAVRNTHPTVKPIDLMRWLTRLITPPGGTVLDPFAGSGTTGIACGLEGFQFIGIEREPEYAEIARARIAWWAQRDSGDTEAVLQALQDCDADQLDLFGGLA